MAFSERAPEVSVLEETLILIDEAVVADDFNLQDEGEIMKNRAYFEAQLTRAKLVAGHSIKSAQLVG